MNYYTVISYFLPASLISNMMIDANTLPSSMMLVEQTTPSGSLSSRYGDLPIILIFSLCILLILILAGLLFYHNLQRRKGYLELEKVHKAMANQADELKRSHGMIRKANASLEDKVHLRTLELEDRTRQLTRYAHMNAHNLRAPLARIMGLVYLMDKDKDPEGKMLCMLSDASIELDDVVRSMTKILQEDGFFSEETGTQEPVTLYVKPHYAESMI